MEPLTVAVATVLGKYAIDQGATLLKEAGEAAVAAARRLFQKVIDRLKADPAEAKNADRFVKNPEGYQTVLADALDDQLKSDPGFAAELQALVKEFEQARSAAITVTNTGSGDVFTGKNAFKVSTNTGTIIYGSQGVANVGNRNVEQTGPATGDG